MHAVATVFPRLQPGDFLYRVAPPPPQTRPMLSRDVLTSSEIERLTVRHLPDSSPLVRPKPASNVRLDVGIIAQQPCLDSLQPAASQPC